MAMRANLVAGLMAAVGLAGCVAPMATTPYGGYEQTTDPIRPTPAPAQVSFNAVIQRVEPVATRYCRELGRAERCDFRIIIDDRPGQPVNAYQTLDQSGRPVLAFTQALIADARNSDELAFVIGHEAAHQILGHIPQQQQNAMTGALLAGVLATAAGVSAGDVQTAQQMGATVAARRYSKDYELQADALGAEIAFKAGFDPLRGTGFFDRLPDPGDKFLGTHPANADRKAVVQQVMRRLQGG
jgi:Zn-dependent protease with chaperone function